jgi:hypothetical protein
MYLATTAAAPRSLRRAWTLSDDGAVRFSFMFFPSR